MRGVALLALYLFVQPTGVGAQGFKFSDSEKADAKARAERQEAIDTQLSTPCKESIKGRKIVVILGEETNGAVRARPAEFDPHFEAINTRLRKAGLRTYSQEEIRKQIAQAVMEANLRNDPEAARTAAQRLGASYTLRGLVSTRAAPNALIAVNEVAVSMKFTLTDGQGRSVAQAQAQSKSFSGSDVRGTALDMINEQADEIVARLYGEYCQRAGVAAQKK